ncbi:D-lactate dehydrogenase VanH-A, partial [Klebsiella pneumoniae]|nr:D-lactate dehydrogenase VanH-A [Klebsiella pneumoniae]
DNQFLLKLQRMPNVIITPHTAYYTEQALRDTVEKTIKNCLDCERRQEHE